MAQQVFSASINLWSSYLMPLPSRFFAESLTGPDESSLQLCPTGAAWTSRAVKDYNAHTDKAVVSYQTAVLDGHMLEPVQVRDVSISECSNRGVCDRSTGE